jgi:hypothetical protein
VAIGLVRTTHEPKAMQVTTWHVSAEWEASVFFLRQSPDRVACVTGLFNHLGSILVHLSKEVSD